MKKWHLKLLVVAGGNGNGNNMNQLNSPFAALVGSDGNLYVADRNNHRIQKVDLNSKILIKAGSISSDIKFTSIKWLGLRCRATVQTEEANLKADIRTKVADASTSLIETPTPIDKDGSVSLLVPDDQREGEAAFLVVLLGGEPVAKEQVTIGG